MQKYSYCEVVELEIFAVAKLCGAAGGKVALELLTAPLSHHLYNLLHMQGDPLLSSPVIIIIIVVIVNIDTEMHECE